MIFDHLVCLKIYLVANLGLFLLKYFIKKKELNLSDFFFHFSGHFRFLCFIYLYLSVNLLSGSHHKARIQGHPVLAQANQVFRSKSQTCSWDLALFGVIWVSTMRMQEVREVHTLWPGVFLIRN